MLNKNFSRQPCSCFIFYKKS